MKLVNEMSVCDVVENRFPVMLCFLLYGFGRLRFISGLGGVAM